MERYSLAFLMIFFCLVLACDKKDSADAALSSITPVVTPTKYLYAVTGSCYSGSGVTTFTATTASNLVLKINTETGNRDAILADYNAAPASSGDTPVGVVDWDSSNLLVLVTNGTSGRIEVLPKTGGNRSNFGLTPGPGTVLATAPRGMIKTADGGLLILRTGFIEKVTSTGIRQGTPWVNSNLGATCGAANALLTSVLSNSDMNNRIVTTHAAASPANRLISVPATGANGSCTAAQASPAATTFPVASVYDSANNKILIAYAGNATTTDLNSIYAYDYDPSTGLISNAQKIYDSASYPATYSFLLFGISSMVLDESEGALYVATAISTATTVVNYAIEKLTYNPTQIGTDNTAVLTRASFVPFYNYGIDTKCVSQMVIGE